METVVAGIGNLENLDSDGSGGFYVTGIIDGYLAHIGADGAVDKLVTGLDHPAGVRTVGDWVYFLTGDGFDAGPGTLQRYDVLTGEVHTLLTGLNGPNGLLELPDGDLLFTTTGVNGPPTGISRYRPSTGEYTVTWSWLPLANGIALAPGGEAVFADNLALQIFRIPLDAPNSPSIVTGVPRILAIFDDMEVTRAGTLFVADHLTGSVFQVDTASGAACTVIAGLIKDRAARSLPDGATSVRIAPHGNGWALFVTSMDGALRRLVPPSGFDLTPADSRP
ncbi:hypothetical protein [Nocardia aurea]|uniref:hypothetical protein n=1 Tax=Nocardia aurea TaxID=2144174 RepID=UPI0033BFB676